jgi:hypothetical protein
MSPDLNLARMIGLSSIMDLDAIALLVAIGAVFWTVLK